MFSKLQRVSQEVYALLLEQGSIPKGNVVLSFLGSKTDKGHIAIRIWIFHKV